MGIESQREEGRMDADSRFDYRPEFPLTPDKTAAVYTAAHAYRNPYLAVLTSLASNSEVLASIL